MIQAEPGGGAAAPHPPGSFEVSGVPSPVASELQPVARHAETSGLFVGADRPICLPQKGDPPGTWGSPELRGKCAKTRVRQESRASVVTLPRRELGRSGSLCRAWPGSLPKVPCLARSATPSRPALPNNYACLDLWALAAQADPLARLLGPAWQSMGYGTLAARAEQLTREAGFARTLARYMADTEAETAGEALEVLAERRADWPKWETVERSR